VIGCADPRARCVRFCDSRKLFKHGEAKRRRGGSRGRYGLGVAWDVDLKQSQGRRGAYLIPDEEAVPVIYELDWQREGLCRVARRAATLRGALRLASSSGARQDDRDNLCDSEIRYHRSCSIPAVHAHETTCRCRKIMAGKATRTTRLGP